MTKQNLLKKILTRTLYFLLITGAGFVLPLAAQPDTIEQYLRKAPDDTIKVTMLNERSAYYAPLDSAMATDYARQALQLASQLRYNKGKAMAMRNLGVLYEYAGQYTRALTFYDKALELYKLDNNTDGIGESLNNFGVVYYLQGDYEKALYYYLQAEHELARKGDSLLYSNILNNIGLIYDKLKQFPKALSYFQQALDIRSKYGSKAKISSCLSNIGMVYQALGNTEKALDYHTRTINLRRQAGDKKGVSASLNNIGDIYTSRKQFDKAIDHFTEALEIKKTIGDRRGISYSLLGLAEANLQKGDLQKAIQFGQQSREIAIAIGLRAHIIDVEATLAEAYSKSGNYAKAYATVKDAVMQKDSLISEEKQATIATMEMRYAFEKMEREKSALSADVQLGIEKLNRSQSVIMFQRIIGIMIMLALLVTIILLYQLKRSNRERERINNELLVSKDNLGNLNKMKDKLLSIIAHDFRSPLATLKGTLDLFENKILDEEEARAMVKQSGTEVNNTLTLLDNLLQWSNSQLKGFMLNIQAFDLRKITDQNYTLLSPQAAQKKIRIENRITEPIKIIGDVDMLNLVVRNLLSNAIKFSRENDTIKLYASKENNMVTVFVEDSGLGIKPQQLAKIFDFEHAVSTYGTANEKGIGLGLSLCRNFVERNGGNIYVTSEPGKGSKFYFTVPAA